MTTALVSERAAASKLFPIPHSTAANTNFKEIVNDLEKALYAAKIIIYAQGRLLYGV